MREQSIFQYSKEAEMKEMLGNLAEGQIEFYKAVRPSVHMSLKVLMFCRRWKNGTESSLLYSAFAWTFSRVSAHHGMYYYDITLVNLLLCILR